MNARNSIVLVLAGCLAAATLVVLLADPDIADDTDRIGPALTPDPATAAELNGRETDWSRADAQATQEVSTPTPEAASPFRLPPAEPSEQPSTGKPPRPATPQGPLLHELLSGLPNETEEQSHFRTSFMMAVREGALRGELRQCLNLILEQRRFPSAMLVLQFHYRREGDEFQVDLAAVESDALELEETECLLDPPPDLTNLPLPTWLEDGEEHTVTFPFQIYNQYGP